MKILVVKLSSLGDVCHALPAVELIKNETGAEAHWAVQPEFAELVRSFSCVSKVIEVPRPSKFSGWLKALRELRGERYDAVADLQGLLKSAVVAGLSKSGKRYGPAYSREGAKLFYDATPPKTGRKHAVEECLDVAELAVNYSTPPFGHPPFGENSHFGASTKIPPKGGVPEGRGGLRIAIAPRSRWDSKNWPAKHFDKLIQLLGEKGVEICLVGGKDDDAELTIPNFQFPILNFCGKCTLAQSAELIKSCDCLVTNDSGPMHIAAALGVRCVALFGPTDAARTGPYGAGHTVLRGGSCELAPCYKRVCPKGTKECLAAITPETMFDSVSNPGVL